MTRFITEKEAILLNALMIKKYTPLEDAGVKDWKMLDSALNRPKASAFGTDAYPTIWHKGAALYASISQNHAFFNANKRTGFAAMKQFLWVNGFILDVDEETAEEYTMEVVKIKPEIHAIARWLQRHSIERP